MFIILVVADADEEIHKQVQENAILARVCPSACRPTCDCWIGWFNTQYSKLWLSGSPTGKCRIWKHLLGRRCTDTKEGKTSLQRVKEVNALSRSPLPLAICTNWRTGGNFAICGPHSSLGSCHEWMSLRCWMPRPVSNGFYVCCMTGSGGQAWLLRCRRWSAAVQAMHPISRHLCQSPQCGPSL